MDYVHSKFSAFRWWITYECSVCEKLVLASTASGSTSKEPTGLRVDLLLPSVQSVPEHMPDRAANYLRQALESLAAPDGAVMLAGSAVDAMLKEQGLTTGTVYDRITNAVETGILTKDMGEWAHEVRLGSNRPRHADADDPHADREDAQRSVEFARMLGHILFTLPFNVEAGKAKALERKANAQAATDDADVRDEREAVVQRLSKPTRKPLRSS
jgi:hypothetical protein